MDTILGLVAVFAFAQPIWALFADKRSERRIARLSGNS